MMNRALLNLVVIACLLALLCSSGTVLTAAAESSDQPKNWLPNPSLEGAKDGKPNAWRTNRFGGEAAFEYAGIGHSGKHSVMIASDKGGDAAWMASASVEPFAKYRLSGWIKTEDVKAANGRGALLNVHNIQSVATRALSGTNDWTQVEVVFETEDHDSVQVNCLLGGWGTATGKAWYDDLQLVQLSTSPPQQPRIVIDAAKTGEPISKYVYGQFIEHLGRCIYGGIWAEMLEDRKFFYPVGAKESPWQAIGDAESVKMVREGAFVGEHTPQVALPGDGQKAAGIAQGGLGLVAGKTYVGRIWLCGSGETGPVQASLIWGDGPNQRQTVTIEKLTGDFAATPLKFQASAATNDGRLEITAAGKGTFRLGTVSLMPADNVQGMRADTLELLRQLDSPVYRWPGGNFVSGYDWKDGIGEPDRRPPRKNPAWQGVEHNDFGIDEFMVFCRALKTDPFIAVNSGLGDAKNATDEVEYANGSEEAPMGKLRRANGHAEPYAVRFWSIGNEMYGGWQLGHIPLEKYQEKHNEFAKAMKAVDPSIKLVAVGAVGKWSEGMLTHCADHTDFISEHFYRGEQPGLLAHVRQIPNSVRSIAEAHRKYRREIESLKGKDIRIALDEWNYWYGSHVFGELGTRYFLKDGLGIAAGLNEYARQSDIYYMANYAQTVNVIGCIKTSKTAAAFESTGLVLKLYRRHFGAVPVATEVTSVIDVAAAWSKDRKTLTIAVVNPTLHAVDVPLEVRGAKLSGSGTRWQIAGSDPMAYNDPDKPAAIMIEESRVQGVAEKLSLAPCSVTLFALDVK